MVVWLRSSVVSLSTTSPNKLLALGLHGGGRNTLIEELKQRFRIKAAQRKELDELKGNSTNLTKISVNDARTIWIHVLISQAQLPTNHICMTQQNFDDMGRVLRDKLEIPEASVGGEQRMVDYEEFLPVMVDLVRANTSRKDKIEVANELFDVYFPNYGMKVPLVSNENDMAAEHNLKIKSNYMVSPGQSNMHLVKLLEKEDDKENIFNTSDFILKMKNVPLIL